jgi:hypothetical protein
MLYEFLENHRKEILALTEEKSLKLAGSLPSSEKLKKGLPIFFEHLIVYLREPIVNTSDQKILKSASEHGIELQTLNYTLSHVVHFYGAMCQSITELAQRRNADISAREFNELNMYLDYAIAAAGFDHSGLGLGLTIVQRAVCLLQEKLSVVNDSGHGCAFLIEIPLKLEPVNQNKAVLGENSAQPEPLKKQGPL